jgi:Ras-related GTP-binding protein A/B
MKAKEDLWCMFWWVAHCVRNERNLTMRYQIHKMDLVPAEKRVSVFEQRANEVRQKCHSAGWDYVQIYSTSIWDETLYSAWSDIVATLNPHAASLSTYLTRFARMCNTSEVVLFEKTTLLVISQSKTRGDGRSTSQITAVSEDSPDGAEAWPEDRFAKISQAIKLFRVGCKRLKSEFTSMEIKQHSYTAIFDAFTPKTYILVVSTDEQMGVLLAEDYDAS